MENIEITIINIAKFNSDNGFSIEIKIDNEPKFPFELNEPTYLRICAILLNVYKRFISKSVK